MNAKYFRQFAPVLTDPYAPKQRDKRLLIAEDGKLKVYYAPFEYVNPKARIVLVGITPGPTQMENANSEARSALRRGCSEEEAMKRAKLTASFSGEPLRGNLIKQLDHWGVPQWLGIDNAASLFNANADLLQSTSLLRYPTFVDDTGYNGSPNMIRNPFLRPFLYDHFVDEVRLLPDAVFFGLGPKVHPVLDQLVQNGVIRPEQVASGLLHPSGNNTYRIAYLTGRRSEPAPHATDPRTYDEGRLRFRKRLSTR